MIEFILPSKLNYEYHFQLDNLIENLVKTFFFNEYFLPLNARILSFFKSIISHLSTVSNCSMLKKIENIEDL